MGKGKRLRRLTPRAGDVIELHKDVFFTPAGLYRFKGVNGSIAEFSLGEARIGIPKEALRFCSVSNKELGELEIAQGLARMKARLDSVHDSEPIETYSSHGMETTVSAVDPQIVRALELDG